MLTPLRDYAIGLLVLLAAMAGYQATVTRWVQPPDVAHAPIAVRPLNADDSSLEDLFPADAWQRGRSIRIMTDNGMLLFQHSKQEDRKKWKLWPLTIVIGRGSGADGDERPILVEAAEGAVIEFDRPLDMMSGEQPAIHRGEMIGEVAIRRVQNESSTSQVLDIRTASVGIDRRKIWTLQPIHMRVGDATMVGRDLTLHLAASSNAAGRIHGDVTGTLDRMELVYLRDLILPLGPPGGDRGRVEIRCGGGIEYDFALDQLSLTRDVELLHFENTLDQRPRGDDPEWTDRFDCQSLELTLRDPMNSDLQRETAMDWIDRVVATGAPLRAIVQSQSLDLAAGKVSFDAVAGRLIAQPDPSLGDRVVIRRGQLQASLAGIDYRFDPQSPQQLGSLMVNGGGEITDMAVDAVLRKFNWGDRLEIEPVDENFRVHGDGGLRAELSDGGWFAADHVDGILKPADPSPMPGGQNNQLGQDNQSGQSGRQSPTAGSLHGRSLHGRSLHGRLLPDRFAIGDQVRWRSTTLHADTNELFLFFEEAATGAAPVVATGTADDGTTADVDGTNQALHQWVAQPPTQSPPGVGSLASTSNPAAAKPPATIRGNKIAAKLKLAGRELTSTDLSVDGDVAVSYAIVDANTDSGLATNVTTAPPQRAVLTGDQLLVRNGGTRDVVELRSTSGRPARLDWKDGYFIGPEILARPGDNHVAIPGAGQFVLPSSMLPPIGGNPSATAWTRPPHCRFGGSMTFDGRIAKMVGGVRMDAVLVQDAQPSEIMMWGDELSITLSDAVSMRQPRTTVKPQLSEVTLLQTSSQSVQVQVDRYAGDGIRQSRHQFQTRQLTWQPTADPRGTSAPRAADASIAMSGQIVAPGPGTYHGWFRSTGGGMLGPASPGDNAGTNSRPAATFYGGLIEDGGVNESDDDESLTGVHLIYQGGMQADWNAREMFFFRGVRIARQLLPDFETRFDAAQMDLLSIGQLTLDCQQLRIAMDPAAAASGSTPDGVAAWELEASTGVVFRNRTKDGLVEATANRCSYTSAKDLFTIDSLPGQPARIRQTDPTGQPGAALAMWNMTLRLKTMEIVTSKMASFQLGGLPARSQQ